MMPTCRSACLDGARDLQAGKAAMKRYLLIATSVIVFSSATSECRAQNPTQTPENAREPTPHLHQRYLRYKIQATDVLEISFPFTPDFNQQVEVQPDGFIQLKGIDDDLHVQGKTIAELTESLRLKYSTILQEPLISVVLKEFDKPYFIAGGMVGKPGKYDLHGTTTAAQAIAIAGGFAEGAKNSRVVLFRRYSDEWVETKTLNLKAILEGKNLNEDSILQPGDMLYIPKSTFAKIEKFVPRTSLGTYFGLPIS
jgi:polysaccharide biosynthesis/export protein